MKKKNAQNIFNSYIMDTPNAYDRIDIDSICAEAIRNDAGYYDNNISISDSTSDIIQSLEALCDTL